MAVVASFWHNSLRVLRERLGLFRSPGRGRCGVRDLPTRFNILRPDFNKLPIDTDASEAQLTASLEKIREAWEHLGIVKPHWSVLTQPQFLPGKIGESIEAFYASGEEEAAAVETILARHDCSSLAEKTCLEYGSGVGRVTLGLARRFAWVHGYDISPGHLAIAVERARKMGLSNINFQLGSMNLLPNLPECDVAYSRIVFQHNPPPVQCHLIKHFLRALNPGGTAIFQVLTFMQNYHFNTREWLAEKQAFDIQMHCLPQQKIFAILAAEGCIPLEVGEDDAAGHPDARISNLLVVRKIEVTA